MDLLMRLQEEAPARRRARDRPPRQSRGAQPGGRAARREQRRAARVRHPGGDRGAGGRVPRSGQGRPAARAPHRRPASGLRRRRARSVDARAPAGNARLPARAAAGRPLRQVAAHACRLWPWSTTCCSCTPASIRPSPRVSLRGNQQPGAATKSSGSTPVARRLRAHGYLTVSSTSSDLHPGRVRVARAARRPPATMGAWPKEKAPSSRRSSTASTTRSGTCSRRKDRCGSAATPIPDRAAPAEKGTAGARPRAPRGWPRCSRPRGSDTWWRPTRRGRAAPSACASAAGPSSSTPACWPRCTTASRRRSRSIAASSPRSTPTAARSCGTTSGRPRSRPRGVDEVAQAGAAASAGVDLEVDGARRQATALRRTRGARGLPAHRRGDRFRDHPRRHQPAAQGPARA